jgi:RimJ/RimL family protein N-acetyltransferase
MESQLSKSALSLAFETERLFLKSTTLEDAEFIYELMNTPKWKAFIGDRGVDTVEDASNYISTHYQAQMERLGYSNYTLFRKQDHKRIGICGLYDRVGLEGIDLGYALLPAYEGQGYAYEASLQLVAMAHDNFQLSELKAITLKENTKSQILLEKLGFIYKDCIKVNDQLVKLYLKLWQHTYD